MMNTSFGIVTDISTRTENITPVNQLRKNVEEAMKNQGNKQRVILISTCAYNPAHRMHVEIFKFAKDYLESRKNMVVVGGYVSPSHHTYVKGKCMWQVTPRPENLISAEDRCRLIELSIKDAGYDSWLWCDRWECTQKDFVSFGTVVRKLRDFFRHDEVDRIIYLCGSDHCFGCGGLKSLRGRDLGVCTFYRKTDDDEDDDKEFEKKYQEEEGLYIIEYKDKNNDTSSTKIRKLLSSSNEDEKEELERMMFPSPIDFLKKSDYYKPEKRNYFSSKYGF